MQMCGRYCQQWHFHHCVLHCCPKEGQFWSIGSDSVILKLYAVKIGIQFYWSLGDVLVDGDYHHLVPSQ
eukprot:3532954-Ditylum_brightwellii.AAC.1